MRLSRSRPTITPAEFTFEKGQVFTRGSITFRIGEERGPLVVLESEATLDTRVVPIATLVSEWRSGIVIPGKIEGDKNTPRDPRITPESVVLQGIPLLDGTEAQRSHVLNICKCIEQLRQIGYECLRPTDLLEIDLAAILQSDKTLRPVSSGTIYKWSLRLAQADGDVRAIVPAFRERGGRGSTRIRAEAREALRTEFDRLWKEGNERIIYSSIHNNVEGLLINRCGTESALDYLPSQSTIARLTKSEFPAFEIARRNKGAKAAKRDFATWDPRDGATWPLEVLEFDDKDSHLFLIDDRSGLPCGRGFVTSGVDQKTSVPLGFSTSNLHRSVWSALCTFTNCILPKDKSAPEYRLTKGDVEYSGKFGIAIFDNAMYNHSEQIELTTRDSGVTPAWAKPKTPTEKSKVEHFNKLMDERFFSGLPGYAGKKDAKIDPKVAAKSAVILVGEFDALLKKWAYDDYVNTPGVDGFTPRQRWHEQMRFVKPRYPVDIYRLLIAPTIRLKRQMRKEALLFTGLKYKNDRLAKLRKSLGAKLKIEFRYDPRNMVQIYVFDPSLCELFIVPSANPEYTDGLSLYQHQLIRKMARCRGKTNPSIPELLEERANLYKLVQQCRASGKARERQFSAKTGDVPEPGEGKSNLNNAPTTEFVSDVEAQVDEIDRTELEMSDEEWAVPPMM